MGLLIFLGVCFGSVCIYLVIHHLAGEKEHERKVVEVKNDLSELQAAVDSRNQEVQRWKDFYQNELAQYGEPDSYIGPSEFEYDAHYPWEFITIKLGELEGDTPEKQQENIEDFHQALRTRYRVPQLNEVAFFWEENRLAYIGGRFVQPKDIISVKRSKERYSGETTVTIVTKSLVLPTISVTFSEYDEDDAMNLINTLAAFRHLK